MIAPTARGRPIEPHWQPDEMRTIVVLSGTLYFSYGDKWSESKLPQRSKKPTGAFATHAAQRRSDRTRPSM